MNETTSAPTELDRELVSRAQAVITELLEAEFKRTGENLYLNAGVVSGRVEFFSHMRADKWLPSLADALAPRSPEKIRAEKLAEAERLEAKAAKLREETK